MRSRRISLFMLVGGLLLLLLAACVALSEPPAERALMFPLEADPPVPACQLFDLTNLTGTVHHVGTGPGAGLWENVPALPFGNVAGMGPWCPAAGCYDHSIWIDIPFTVTELTGNVTAITATLEITGSYAWSQAGLVNPQEDEVVYFEVEESVGCDDGAINCQNANVTLNNSAALDLNDGCDNVQPCNGTFNPYTDAFVLGQEAAGAWSMWINAVGSAGSGIVNALDATVEICAYSSSSGPSPTPAPTATLTPTVTATATTTPTATPRSALDATATVRPPRTATAAPTATRIRGTATPTATYCPPERCNGTPVATPTYCPPERCP